VRLKTSRISAEEAILRLLNRGYQIADQIYIDHSQKRKAGTFDKDRDVQAYYETLHAWKLDACQVLSDIFPTSLEENFLSQRFVVSSLSYSNSHQDVGDLVYRHVPTYIDRLRQVLCVDLLRYSDLPIQERLFVEDIDSFAKVRDINPAMISGYLNSGRIELSEDEVQMALEAILDVPFHKKDWGGETNDLYTANLVLNGVRRPTAFLLKGNGLKKAKMTIADCGRNGDQIIRLFQSPAELFVVQYVGPIDETLILDLNDKTILCRSQRLTVNYLVMDGQDTARLLYAYGKLAR
jgi:hypothetical protein